MLREQEVALLPDAAVFQNLLDGGAEDAAQPAAHGGVLKVEGLQVIGIVEVEHPALNRHTEHPADSPVLSGQRAAEGDVPGMRREHQGQILPEGRTEDLVHGQVAAAL